MRILRGLGYTILLTLAMIALPLLVACGGDDGEGTPKPTDTSTPLIEDVIITIGNLTDITGSTANAMEVIDKALDDLADYYNKTILPAGVSLEVISYDGQHDPSRYIPGYEWLKERGSDLIFTGFPAAAATLRPKANQDQTVLFGASVYIEDLLPPGYVFCLGNIPQYDAYTLLNWLAENDWDYKTNGPAKIGGACWYGSAGEKMQEGMKEYAQVHPDQYEWVGSFVTNQTFNWGPEAEALRDCDYVCTPGVWPTFVKQYRDAGYNATFIATDVQMAFLGLIDDANLWNEIDQTLALRSTRWWNEDGAIIDMTVDLLEENHPGSAEEIKRVGVGYIAMHQLNQMLDIIAQTIEIVGAENFDSAALYDTAQAYSQVVDGIQRSSLSETKRDAVDTYGIYEVSAIDKDIFRIYDDWIPTMREP